MAKNRRPDWASDKTDEEHPECLQHADERIGAREKELTENQSRDLPVKQKVVPFDRRADGAGNDSATQLSAMLVFGDTGNTALGSGHDISSRSLVRFPQRCRHTLLSPAFPVALWSGLSLLAFAATANYAARVMLREEHEWTHSGGPTHDAGGYCIAVALVLIVIIHAEVIADYHDEARNLARRGKNRPSRMESRHSTKVLSAGHS